MKIKLWLTMLMRCVQVPMLIRNDSTYDVFMDYSLLNFLQIFEVFKNNFLLNFLMTSNILKCRVEGPKIKFSITRLPSNLFFLKNPKKSHIQKHDKKQKKIHSSTSLRNYKNPHKKSSFPIEAQKVNQSISPTLN